MELHDYNQLPRSSYTLKDTKGALLSAIEHIRFNILGEEVIYVNDRAHLEYEASLIGAKTEEEIAANDKKAFDKTADAYRKRYKTFNDKVEIVKAEKKKVEADPHASFKSIKKSIKDAMGAMDKLGEAHRALTAAKEKLTNVNTPTDVVTNMQNATKIRDSGILSEPTE
jgi:prophage DNA circulation protein